MNKINFSESFGTLVQRYFGKQIFVFTNRRTHRPDLKLFSFLFFTIGLFFLLEMFPSFPCQRQERKLACFGDLADFCCDSIQRDCQSGTFSVNSKERHEKKKKEA